MLKKFVVGGTALAMALTAWFGFGRTQAGAQTDLTKAPTMPPGMVELKDETPEWVPPEKLGRFEGHCADGKPVEMTVVDGSAETAEGIIRPLCVGTFLVTDVASKNEGGINLDDPALRPKVPADFSQGVTLRLNGYSIVDPRREKDVYPYIAKSGRTLIPARWVVEAIGGKLGWDQATQTVVAMWDDRQVILQIGNSKATVNGTVVVLDQPPALMDGRTMVPLRFILEAFGAQLEYDAFNGGVDITLEGAKCPASYCYEKQSEGSASVNE